MNYMYTTNNKKINDHSILEPIFIMHSQASNLGQDLAILSRYIYVRNYILYAVIFRGIWSVLSRQQLLPYIVGITTIFHLLQKNSISKRYTF